MKKCPTCGKEFEDSLKFCQIDGAELVAQEPALLAALQSGQVSAAGLDVFSTEPLPPEHPLWSMPQVIVSPHYCGDTVNDSAQPAQRFARNLHAWLRNQPLEGLVNCEWGY